VYIVQFKNRYEQNTQNKGNVFMMYNPWKKIESDRDIIHYKNEALPSVTLEIIAMKFEPQGMDKRKSWWMIEYFVNGDSESTILENQNEEFFNKYGLISPLVVKGKKNAMKAISEFINPKEYRFYILTHQHIPRGFSTNNYKKASELLKKAKETDPNAVIIDNQDFYPESEWTW